MKLLMLIVPTESRDKIESALQEESVFGYTEVPSVLGNGQTGLRLGSRAFPETSSLILIVLQDEKVDTLIEALKRSCPDCAGAMHAVIWGVDRML